MFDRETIFPLVAGVVVAVLVNLLLLPAATQMGGGGQWRMPRIHRTQKPVIESAIEQTLGVDEARVSSVAWIPYDAYEQLVAPKAKNLQPAVQQEVDPLPDAPLPADPTPPSPAAPDDAATAAPTAPPTEAIMPVSPSAAAPAVIEHPSPPPTGDLPAGPPQEESQTNPTPPSPQSQPQPTPAPPTASAGGRPTSAPKVDRDADPVMITDTPLPVKPGRVLAAEGIEIKTVRPQFSITSIMTSAPRNPVVSITFEPDGTVFDAQILESSGYADIDGPILTSLYRWRAGGDKLTSLARRFTGEWKIILVDE